MQSSSPSIVLGFGLTLVLQRRADAVLVGLLLARGASWARRPLPM